MEQERWRPIIGYNNLYQISDKGRIRSNNYNYSGKYLKPRLTPKNYFRVILTKSGCHDNFFVHRLVWEAFKYPVPDGWEVDHKDFNTTNNNIENLRLLPKKINSGRHSDGWRKTNSDASRAKNSKQIEQLTIDGQFVRKWESIIDVERELGIHNGNISLCCKGIRKTAGGFVWRYAD